MLIGISGKARNGKTTVAKMLVDEFRFRKYALADELKLYLIKYFGVSENDLYEKKTVESRKLAQGLGVFVREEVDEDFWVNKFGEKIIYDDDINIVIDDIRFKNEAKYIKEAGGILIRINRPGVEAEAGKDHPSEIDLDDWPEWDYVIQNGGTIEELHLVVSDIMYELIADGRLEK